GPTVGQDRDQFLPVRHYERDPVEHIAGPRPAQDIASNAEDAEFPVPLGPYLRPRLGRGWLLLVTGLRCPGRHARPLTPAPRGKATLPAAPAPSTVHSPLIGQVRHVTLRTSRSRSRLPARHRAPRQKSQDSTSNTSPTTRIS